MTKLAITARCVVHHFTMDAWLADDESNGWHDHPGSNLGCRIVGYSGGHLTYLTRGKAPERKATA